MQKQVASVVFPEFSATPQMGTVPFGVGVMVESGIGSEGGSGRGLVGRVMIGS